MTKTSVKPGVFVVVAAVAVAVIWFVLALIRWMAQVQQNQAGVNFNYLKLAVLMYADDYEGRLPPMRDAQTFRRVLRPYVRVASPFYRFPDKTVQNLPNPNLSFKKLSGIKQPAILLFESAPAPVDNSRWVAFYPEQSVPTPFNDPDFRGLKRIREPEWQQLRQKHKLP